ncbi:hypothetical protein M9H77_21239 [Catharanthus roseus]|uniref:Uncharacterized protein n=1 Tax=Catharanthus roseus TaxID=4058 RepID=A0ACC0AMH2_CATRO|nr:hypothetical protein M9H77_21239 [Catharanthus roseus]
MLHEVDDMTTKMLEGPPSSLTQYTSVMRKVQAIICRCMVSIGADTSYVSLDPFDSPDVEYAQPPPGTGGTSYAPPSPNAIGWSFDAPPPPGTAGSSVPPTPISRASSSDSNEHVFDKFLRIELKSRNHIVTTYNPQEGIHMVKSPIRLDGSDNNVYTLKMNEKSCSCGKWKEYTLPCSHDVLVVCKDNGTRPDTYVSDIYSREAYRRTYQSKFYLVGHEDFRRDASCNLIFYPLNMNNQQGRKQGKIDYRNPDSPPRCSICRMPGHNRKYCNNPSSSNV